MTTSFKLGQSKHRPSDLGATYAKTATVILQSVAKASVDGAYWLRRKGEELTAAGSASSEKARLIHLELASRYSAKAGEQ